jgi:hypothetical protein
MEPGGGAVMQKVGGRVSGLRCTAVGSGSCWRAGEAILVVPRRDELTVINTHRCSGCERYDFVLGTVAKHAIVAIFLIHILCCAPQVCCGESCSICVPRLPRSSSWAMSIVLNFGRHAFRRARSRRRCTVTRMATCTRWRPHVPTSAALCAHYWQPCSPIHRLLHRQHARIRGGCIISVPSSETAAS